VLELHAQRREITPRVGELDALLIIVAQLFLKLAELVTQLLRLRRAFTHRIGEILARLTSTTRPDERGDRSAQKRPDPGCD
jgi:hypothetical protein